MAKNYALTWDPNAKKHWVSPAFGDETPVSLSAAVRQDGLDWTQVVSTNVAGVGVAFGTQTDPPSKPPYDDSYAVIRAGGIWLPDQKCEVTIHKESGNSGNGEVWAGVRWTDGAHTSKGYEANLHYAGSYATITQWPVSGALGTNFSQYRELVFSGSVRAPNDGDVLGLQIIGYTLTSYLRSMSGGDIGTTYTLCTVTDTDVVNRFSSGNPCFGFYQDGGVSASRKYGITKVEAWEL